MIKNYFKIGWRNMMKNKFFSFINIFGLSVGLACCMLIALYLNYETSFDSQHRNAPNVYQVITAFVQNGSKRMKMPNTPAPMAGALKQEYPEVVESARLLKLFIDDKTIIQYNPANGERKSLLEQNGFMADQSFFKIFTYNFTEGNVANVLTNPRTIVISKKLAEKLFGNQPALSKVIHVNSNTNGEQDYTITGVFDDGKVPSHINANFFLSVAGGSMEGFIKRQGNDYASNNMFYTYLLLKPGTNPATLQAKLPAFIDKYAGKDLKNMGFQKEQSLLALRDIHLSSEVESNVTAPASKTSNSAKSNAFNCFVIKK